MNYLLLEKIDRFWQLVGRDSLQGMIIERLYVLWLSAPWGKVRRDIYYVIEKHIAMVSFFYRDRSGDNEYPGSNQQATYRNGNGC